MAAKPAAWMMFVAAMVLASTLIRAAGTEPAVNTIDFTWEPTDPEIGELVEFTITGAPGTIDVAHWSFDEPGCSGFPETAICTPLFVSCILQGHKFASAGPKTVSLVLTVSGQVYPAVSRTVTVSNVGSCGGGGGGGCTFGINPSAASYPAAGGSGTVGISTQDGCAWDASSNVEWITLDAASGIGSSDLGYTVAVNTGAYRSGTVRAAGKNHTVTQAQGPPVMVWSGWQQSASAGAGNQNNTAASCMAAFGGYLYVATENPTTGLEVLRSSDGQVWSPVATGGFGDGDNVEATALVVFGGQLLLTTTNETTGGQVWQSPDGVSWSKASPDGFLDSANTSASAMAEFAGDLYVGTSNEPSGGQVWRTPDASQWSQVNTSGFGSSTNASVTALAGFNSQLYAGATGFWGFRLFRRTSGLSWSQIGLDGFGDNTNTHVTTLVDVGGELLLGTRNELTGGEVWSSTTGSSWSQINEDGFGAFVNRAVSFLTLYDTVLIAGVANPQSGGAVWAYDGLDGWYKASEDGFGDQYSVDLPAAAELNGTLYVGTENPFGFQIWRHVPGLLFADGFELGSGGEWTVVTP